MTVDLPGHRSLEVDFNTDTSDLRFRLESADLPALFRTAKSARGRSLAKLCEFMCDPRWGDPRSATVVTLDQCGGNTFWTKNFIVACLRLFAEGDIRGGCDIHVESNGRVLLPPELRPDTLPRSRDERINIDQMALLAGHFRAVHSACARIHASPELGIAARYFFWSYEGRRLRNDHGTYAGSFEVAPLEDIVLRLSISLEALFCPEEPANPKAVIARRAARLLARDPSEHRLICALCSWCYEVRSDVAHGKFVGFRPFRQLAGHAIIGRQVDWNYVVMSLRHVVRRSILSLAASADTDPVAEQVLRLDRSRSFGAGGYPVVATLGWPVNPRDGESDRIGRLLHPETQP